MSQFNSDLYGKGYAAGRKSAAARLLQLRSELRDFRRLTPTYVYGVTYPIPLREGVIARLAGLPLDLTEKEAERICAVVRALAVPPKEQP